jgi:hypothetical protein
MRQWLAEGRITPDSLVWCEGWPDWKLAGATFPSLGSSGGMPASGGAPPGVPVSVPSGLPGNGGMPGVVVTGPETSPGDPFAAIVPTTPTSSLTRRSRRKDGAGRMMAIAVLCVALIVLSALLVYVLKLR